MIGAGIDLGVSSVNLGFSTVVNVTLVEPRHVYQYTAGLILVLTQRVRESAETCYEKD